MKFTTASSFDLVQNPFSTFHHDDSDDSWLFQPQNQHPEVRTPPVRLDPLGFNDDSFFNVVDLQAPRIYHVQAVQVNNLPQVRRRIRKSRANSARNQQGNRNTRASTGPLSQNMPKKPRNRTCDNSVGYTIAAIKDRLPQLIFDAIFEGDSERIQKIENCIRDLTALIQKLKSSNGNLSDMRILINPTNEKLIEEIQNKVGKSKIEELFVAILNRHDKDVVNEAKKQIMEALIKAMNSKWMKDFAYSMKFKQEKEDSKTVDEKKREFHIYLSFFKKNLRREKGIAATINRKEFMEFKLQQI